MKGYLLCFVLFAFYSCAVPKGYAPSAKIAPAQQRADFTILKKVLEANHPSLYWYTSKDSLEYYFTKAYNSLNDSLLETAYRKKVANFISQIHCGHTSVLNSSNFYASYKNYKGPIFPLAIKAWKDTLIVLASLQPKDSIFKRGTLITAINGRSNRQILDSFYQYISTDGYNNNFKSLVTSINFGGHYRNVFGLDSLYTITYLDSLGNNKTAQLRNYYVKKDSTSKKEKLDENVIKNLVFDSSTHTALLRVRNFSEAKQKQFFDKSFRQINKRGIKNLVIDIRENGGGSVGKSTYLLKYLKEKNWRFADTIATNSRKLQYSSYIYPSFIYWLSLNILSKKMDDGKYHFRHYERHEYAPKKKDHFDGNIYIIQSGYTFSAATYIVDALQGQRNVTVVGEETGGGSYGNTAMHITKIVLPNSGLQIMLPLYRVVWDSTRAKTGHGFMPDVPVYPSSQAIKEGRDIKMDTVMELIGKHK